MNISICTTVLNEEGTIGRLLDSLLDQTKKASEILIVDGGSTDKTVEIIRHYQKKHGNIKLVIEKSSRAKARNLSIEIAEGDVIAMTDAGCVAHNNWLKNITEPFNTGKVDVAAGFYKMTGATAFQKAESVFLGITPRKFNHSFLPSTRSIAFTKRIWVDIGGFPENARGTAEDTLFNYKLLNFGAKISRVKDAIVEWGMPFSILEFSSKLYGYSKGDAKSKIIIFPGKGIMSHNIKVLFVFLRYALGLTLLLLGINNHQMLAYLLILFIIYLLWAFRKLSLEFGDSRISLWGPILQIVSDFSVMGGFVSAVTDKGSAPSES